MTPALSLHMARIITPAKKSSSPTKFFGEGLTFDDVLLLPAFSQVLPRETDVKTNLTRKNHAEDTHAFRRDGHGDGS